MFFDIRKDNLYFFFFDLNVMFSYYCINKLENRLREERGGEGGVYEMGFFVNIYIND